MIELVAKRQENSKTFKLDSRRNQLVVSSGAIHYKDDYADKREQWKDIDLTWKDNKITKAPYMLTRKGNKLTIKNKKNGEVSTIELLEDATPDVDIEVVPEFSRVRFTRILKSAYAPLTAKFRVKGNFIVRASDEDGEIPVESSIKDGILTETLKPDRPVKYPVRIDPTWQVGTGSDDVTRHLGPVYWNRSGGSQQVGSTASNQRRGGGMRFTNITIPQGATILDGTHLTFRADSNRADNVCNSRISAEDIDAAPTFANDSAVFDTRWAARTAARVDWDAIGAWTTDNDYNSSEIKTVIKEIVDRGGWNSGQDIVIFWEDYAERSDTDAIRVAYSYEGNSTYCSKLVVVYQTVPDPPTNVAATDGSQTSKVVITWTKSSGATNYEVFRDGVGLGEIGDVATYDDFGADAGVITPGTPDASDGTSVDHVVLSLAGESVANGTTHTYKVRAKNAGGWSGDSNTNTGYRGVGSLTRQWYRSSGDSNASYSSIGGATSDPYNDTGAPAGVITPGTASATDGTSADHVTLSLAGESVADGAGRWYKCLVSATGTTSQYSTANRGYRGVGGIGYQWQRSAADSDASYSNIAGGTTDPYNDTGAPSNGDGRYFRCVLSATGTSNQTSTADRGYRDVSAAGDGSSLARAIQAGLV